MKDHQDKLFLSGEVNFSNVNLIYQNSLDYFQQASLSEFQIDCSSLESNHSIVLALLIEWIKLAKQMNKPIHFFHLSTKLMAVAKSAGLDELLAV